MNKVNNTQINNPKTWSRSLRYKVTQELGLSKGAIYQWDKVPVLRVPAVSKITGYKSHELRPDVFEVTP